jgi:hypothetical protein
MGGELSTPACQIKSHVLWMKFEPGWPQLKDGLIAFKSEARGLLFRVPLAEDAKPAKAAMQQWRAALGLRADRGH